VVYGMEMFASVSLTLVRATIHASYSTFGSCSQGDRQLLYLTIIIVKSDPQPRSSATEITSHRVFQDVQMQQYMLKPFNPIWCTVSKMHPLLSPPDHPPLVIPLTLSPCCQGHIPYALTITHLSLHPPPSPSPIHH